MPSARTNTGGRSGGSVGEQIGTMLGNAMADLVICELFNQNCPPGMQKNADNPAVREQYHEMNQERQAMVDKATEEEALRVRQSSDRIRAALSGGSGGLQARDLNAPVELQTEVVTGQLGSKEVKPIFGGAQQGAIYQTASLGPLKQLRCADALMKKAVDLSNNMTAYERYSASESASSYLSGAPATMSCADSDLAPLKEVQTPDAAAVLSKQILVKSKLFSQTVKLQEDLVTLNDGIKKAHEKEKEAAEAKKHAEEKIQSLSKDTDSDDPAKKSAMAEALRALDESNRVLKENQALVAEKEAEKTKGQKELIKTTDLYSKAINNPNDADGILSQIQ